jgi:hypothetical protein
MGSFRFWCVVKLGYHEGEAGVEFVALEKTFEDGRLRYMMY